MPQNVLTYATKCGILYLPQDVAKPNKGDDLMSMAERLVQARAGRNRKSVCDAVGISLSALSMYENGMRVPRDKSKIRLAQVYQTSVQDLFFPEDDTNSGLNEED